MTIDPPNQLSPPKWAQTLVAAANARNRQRGSKATYSMDDLISAWTDCRGCCAVSGLPFSMEVIGDGQARRPFAPSLDRVRRQEPYHRGNVRIVVAIANFAMNAWGLEPLKQLATAVHRKFGDEGPSRGPGPSDSELDDIAPTDADAVETDIGMLAFCPRQDMHEPILAELRDGARSSRQIEEALATRFRVEKGQRMAKLRNGCPAWRNHVAWALVDLGHNARGTGQIVRLKTQRAPDGGTMGLYSLTPEVPTDDDKARQ